MGKDREFSGQHRSRFREHELKLMRKMFEEAPVAMGILEGPDLRIQYMNRYLHKLYGNRPFSRGIPLREFRTQQEGRRMRGLNRLQMMDQVCTTGEPFISSEFKACIDQTNMGALEEGYFNFICQPLADGQVYGIFVTGNEVAKHVEARQKQFHSEKRLTLALEGADPADRYFRFPFLLQTIITHKFYSFPYDRRADQHISY